MSRNAITVADLGRADFSAMAHMEHRLGCIVHWNMTELLPGHCGVELRIRYGERLPISYSVLYRLEAVKYIATTDKMENPFNFNRVFFLTDAGRAALAKRVVPA
jgi:hypothetical protein